MDERFRSELTDEILAAEIVLLAKTMSAALDAKGALSQDEVDEVLELPGPPDQEEPPAR